MVYSVIIHLPRKPGLSSEEFKHHWENVHVPLLKILVGDEFPLSHTRHYVEKPVYSPASSPPIDPALNKGHLVPSTLGGVDGVAILTFANKEHYGRFHNKLAARRERDVYEKDLSAFVDVCATGTLFAVSDSP